MHPISPTAQRASPRRARKQSESRGNPEMGAQDQLDMKQRIIALAQDLMVKHGVRGVSFGDIAEILKITRANIHYHFGSKNALVDEVIREYVLRTQGRFSSVWIDEHLSLAEKLERTIQINRERYLQFNESGTGGNAWSLFTRMRADADALGPIALELLRNFSAELDRAVQLGLQQAIDAETLGPNTPISAVGLQFVNIMSCAGLTTQDGLSFDRLDRLYRTCLEMTMAAYGSRRPSKRPVI